MTRAREFQLKKTLEEALKKYEELRIEVERLHVQQALANFPVNGNKEEPWS